MNKFLKQYIIRASLFGYLFFFLGVLHAQTYYVSSLNGNDSNNGTSPATAWATIEQVNRVIPSLRPGNSVLFERGGLYYGSMTVRNVSGSENNPITFGAYGEGEAPIISGARQITNWQQIDENLWQAHLPERSDNIDILFINGKKYYPARFPNKGHRIVTNYYPRGLQDSTLNFPDGYWNGATVAFKVHEWEIRRDTVAYSYSDGRIDKIGDNFDKIPTPGWGFFFQNHLNAIDTIGEWVYDKQHATLTLCTIDDPNEQFIEYMDTNYGLEINCSSTPNRNCYIYVEDLLFRHYRNYGIYATHGNGLEIRRNTLTDCWSGLGLGGFYKCIVSDNIFSDMENTGLTVGNLIDSRIHNNVVKRVGTSLDHGWSAGIAMQMFINDQIANDGCEIINNKIDSTGYNGMFIMFSQNLLVKNNVINHSMLCLSDGGGIYFGYNPAIPRIYKGNQIIDNIVMNTTGNSVGSTSENNIPWRHGIYLDDGTGHVTVQGNTVVNSGGGIFFHGAHHNKVLNNVLYNNSIANIVAQDEQDKNTLAITGNEVLHNYIYQNGWNTYLMSIIYPDILVNTNQIDSNYISAPFSQNFTNLYEASTRTTWSAMTDFDLHSHTEPVPYELSGAGSPEEYTILVYNPTPRDSVFQLEHTYMSFDSTIHTGSILLHPYKSAILFRYKEPGDSLDAPVGNNNLCIGSSDTYKVPDTLNLAAVDTVIWTINPPAAGLIKSVSGDKGSVIEITWLPNFHPSPAQLTYGVRMIDSSIRMSRPLTINLMQDVGRPPTPTGPIDITDPTATAIFTADNPGGAEIEWIIPPAAGTLSPYDKHGNEVTVTWKPNLLGRYTITYRLRNSCGEWGAEAFPLYYYFPVEAPSGPDVLCEGVRTCFTAPPYTDMTSGFTWVLEPSDAGYLESNGNEACVTLNKSAANQNVMLYYTGRNNIYRPFRSPSTTLIMNTLPETPARPTGTTSLSWNIASSNYTADTGMEEYEWQILPSSAGTIEKHGNQATINWAGGADHDYVGQVQISYRVKKKDNSCGFSDYSPALTVTLLPKPPVTAEMNPCAATQTSFSTKTYLGASSYRWSISPSSAGTIIGQSNSNVVTIAWAPSSSGMARITYSVVDAAKRIYTSEYKEISIRPLPNKPSVANGPSTVNWNVPSSVFTASSAGDSYEWQIEPAAAGTLIPNGNSVAVNWAGGTDHIYTGSVEISYRITKADNDCGFSEFAPALQVNLLPKPTITLSTYEATICAGSSITLTATTEHATGILWENYSTTGNATGERTNVLHYSSFPRTSDTTFYIYARVFGASSEIEVSDSVKITLKGNPKALISNLSTTEACVGSAVSFDFITTNSTYYQCLSGDGVWLPARQSQSLNYAQNSVHFEYTPDATERDNTLQLIIKAGSEFCENSYETASVTIHVNPRTAITTQPAGATICQTESHTFRVASEGLDVTYQWQKESTSGVWNNLANTTDTYHIDNASPDDAGNYRVVASGTCGETISNIATLVVNGTTVITEQLVGAKLYAGESYTLRVKAENATNYQWQKWRNTIWDDIAGTINPFYTIYRVSAADSGSYRVIVNGLCNSVISNTATIALRPPCLNIVVFQWPDVPSIDNNPATNGGYTFVEYQWYKNGVLIPGITRPYYQVPASEMGSNYVYACKMLTDTGEEMEVCPFTVTPPPTTPEAQPFLVFPNPAGKGQTLTIQTGMDASMGEFEVNIYDLGGTLRKQYRSIQTVIEVTVPNSSGYYLVQLKAKGSRTVRNATIVVQ